MKFTATSVLATFGLASTVVSAASTPTIRTTDVPSNPELEERTFGLIGDIFNPTYGNQCNNGLFFWSHLGKCVKPSNSNGQPPSSTKSCPSNWSWSPDYRCCKPNKQNVISNPICSKSGHSWLGNLLFCGQDDFTAPSSNACNNQYQFWWGLGGLCCKSGGGSDAVAPPADKDCPVNWYYSSKYNFCVPTSSNHAGSTQCSNGSWDSSSKCCKVNKRDSHGCDSGTQFWWGLGNFCLDNGHDTSGKCPDSSKSCPNNYSWSTSKGICIPNDSNACNNVGSCTNSKHSWSSSSKWCQPSKDSNGCDNGLQFWWGLGSLCIDSNHDTSGKCPDSNKSCPNNYSWSSSKGFCIPNNQNACDNVGSCTNNAHVWSKDLKYCKAGKDQNGCDSGLQFWWGLGSICIDWNHDTNGKCPDSNKSCPNNYSWSSSKGFCIPNNQNACGNVGSCTNPKHSWSSSSKWCQPGKDSNGCDLLSQFWWPLGNSCLDNDHDTSGKCPDNDKSCPNNYSWSYKKGHCIPNNSNACGNVGPCTNRKHTWWSNSKWCSPQQPSQRKRRERRITSTLPLGVVDASRCPDGGTACPLSFGSLDYECLKPLEEIESCGGCITLGQGQDCTAIAGAKSVGCNVGVCEVYKCSRGYTLGDDRKSCVPTSSMGSTAYLTAQARHSKKARN